MDYISLVDYESNPAVLLNPEWGKGGRIHNWKNHVGENTKAIWSTFTHEQRVAIMKDAEDEAGREEWD